ncbi:hypothetical protein KAJ27_13045 [bacterium]|nr:hypothetical protein [bacterium]
MNLIRVIFFIALMVTCSFYSLYAESILTLPVPTEIETYGPAAKDVRPMVLKISMPPRKKRGEDAEPKDEDELKPRQDRFKYFNFNPFPTLNVEKKYLKTLKRLGRLGLGTGQYFGDGIKVFFRSNKKLNIYDFNQILRIVFFNFSRRSVKFLIKNYNWKKEDIQNIEEIATIYKQLLNNYGLDQDGILEKIIEMKKFLNYNQGVVRVIKVENDDKGSTILHFVFKPTDEEKQK